jgi:hypothetical protein
VVEPRPPGVALTYNPLALLVGTFALEVEFRLASRVSGYVLGYFQSADFLLSPPVNSTGIQVGARFYIGSVPVQGLWLGIDGGGLAVWADSAAVSGQAYSATLGYTWVSEGRYVFSIGGGGQLVSFELTDVDGRRYDDISFRPILRLAAGFAF